MRGKHKGKERKEHGSFAPMVVGNGAGDARTRSHEQQALSGRDETPEKSTSARLSSR